MITGEYQFLAQDRVTFGIPAAQAVADCAARLGKHRVLIVTSKSLNRGTNAVKGIADELGGDCVGIYDECVTGIPRDSILKLLKAVKELNPDLIVTVGGGTAMDSVKVMLVMLAHGVTKTDQFGDYHIRVDENGNRVVPVVQDPPIRQVIVPTTLSAAEFSCLGGATDIDRQVRDIYTGRYIGGQEVILDPAMTVHTPDWLWLSTGIRAVDHAVETVCSRNPQPFTDATCLHALEMLTNSLKQTAAEPGDLDARQASQLGAWLASTGLGRIEWGASHGIGHQLGAVAAVPHGHTSCVMLPSVLRWNQSVNAPQQTKVARAMGRTDGDAAQAVADLVASVKQPGNLQAVGVKREHFEAIANGAMQNFMVRTNPRPIHEPEQVLEILEMAWQGH